MPAPNYTRPQLFLAALNDITFGGRLCLGLLRGREPEQAFAELPSSCNDEAVLNRYREFDLGAFEDRLAALLEKHAVGLLALGNPSYPERLAVLTDPPPLLYVRGSIADLGRPLLAGVGSRKASRYGLDAVRALVPGLVEAGLGLVSGLARGIDAEVHRATLAAGGRTVAVLGCGIGTVYPPEHTELADAVANQGAVISEFPIDHGPLSANFPRRNRVISGLGLGVVVFEAALRSGSLVTAYQALHQNREVFAVPRSMFDRDRQGTNALLSRGAKLVTTVEHILEELTPLGLVTREPERPNKELLVPTLTSDQALVIECLDPERAVTLDQVVNSSGLSPEAALAALLELSLVGVVVETKGARYLKSNR